MKKNILSLYLSLFCCCCLLTVQLDVPPCDAHLVLADTEIRSFIPPLTEIENNLAYLREAAKKVPPLVARPLIGDGWGGGGKSWANKEKRKFLGRVDGH